MCAMKKNFQQIDKWLHKNNNAPWQNTWTLKFEVWSHTLRQWSINVILMAVVHILNIFIIHYFSAWSAVILLAELNPL